jgi:periplasmic copper chaperone A
MLSHVRSYVLPTALILASFSSLVQAQEYKAGSLTITQPWVRATPGGAQVGGGFLTITNTGTTPDRFLGGTLSGADRVEVHVTSNEGGVSRMRPVEGGIEIKPGETVTLVPGSYHLMLMDLKGSFIDGERVEGTLQFEKAGTVRVEFEVRPVGAKAPAERMPKH